MQYNATTKIHLLTATYHDSLETKPFRCSCYFHYNQACKSYNLIRLEMKKRNCYWVQKIIFLFIIIANLLFPYFTPLFIS